MIKILFLAANPADTVRLNLEEEIRAIDLALQRTQYRSQFDLRSYQALRIGDIQELLLRYKPDIVHLSGHGSDTGEIILLDETRTGTRVPAYALRDLFGIMSEHIRCVVLNSCYSLEQAEVIAEHIDCVIGMPGSVSEQGAIEFSTAFYQAIGYGQTVKNAFNLACNQLKLVNTAQMEQPHLLGKRDPSKTTFAVPPGSTNRHAMHDENVAQRGYDRYIVDFGSLISDRTKDFHGRTFVFEQVNQVVSTEKNAYTVIQGDPGIGKTAVMAELVRRFQCVHHFNIVEANIRSHQDFILNVCAQLIVKYGLTSISIPDSQIDRQALTNNASFLTKCLSEAAASSSVPVMVVIDALDESDWRQLPPKANILFLPRELPDGVFIVVSTRRIDSLPLVTTATRIDIDLTQDSMENLNDIRGYLGRYCAGEVGKGRLKVWGMESETFVEMLTSRSQGNFMYLRFVLTDIAAGRLARDDFSRLPVGLRGYYLNHWHEMQESVGAKDFLETHERVVCILAAFPEPLPVHKIAEYSQLTIKTVESILRAWQQFLFCEYEQGEKRYRLYHHSYADFLQDKVNIRDYKQLLVDAFRAKVQTARKKT